MQRTCLPLVAQARSCGSVSWHLMQCPVVEIRVGKQRVSNLRLLLSCTTTLDTDRTTRRSLRVISHPSAAASNKNTTFDITDGEAMTTWILTPNQRRTQLSGHASGGSQMLSEIQPNSRCEVPAMMVRTSFVKRAEQQNKSCDFSGNCKS